MATEFMRRQWDTIGLDDAGRACGPPSEDVGCTIEGFNWIPRTIVRSAIRDRRKSAPRRERQRQGSIEAPACSFIVRRRFAHHRSIAFSAAIIASRLGPAIEPSSDLGDMWAIQVHWLRPTATLISYLTPRCSTKLGAPLGSISSCAARIAQAGKTVWWSAAGAR